MKVSCSSKIKPRLRAKWGSADRAAVHFRKLLRPIKRNSILDWLKVKKISKKEIDIYGVKTAE